LQTKDLSVRCYTGKVEGKPAAKGHKHVEADGGQRAQDRSFRRVASGDSAHGLRTYASTRTNVRSHSTRMDIGLGGLLPPWDADAGDTRLVKRFQELLADHRGGPFEFQGETVHGLYEREVAPGTCIDVEFLTSRQDPPQGLEVKARDARLAWDEHGVEGQAVRLWADKQREGTLRYVNPRKRANVRLWNIWLDRRKGTEPYQPDSWEMVQAWWAWSGMLVQEQDNGAVELRCSGNYDEPSFDDLVVRVTFRP
jgi:hypothetical protein